MNDLVRLASLVLPMQLKQQRELYVRCRLGAAEVHQYTAADAVLQPSKAEPARLCL